MGTPAITKVREAFLYSIKQMDAINYFISIPNVYDPPISIEQFQEYPSANLYWDKERNENDRMAGNNALYDLTLPVTVEVWAKINNYSNMVDEQDKIIAGLMKYFGIHHYVPDSDGEQTAFIALYAGSERFGRKEDMPHCGVLVDFEIKYRVRVNNPEIIH